MLQNIRLYLKHNIPNTRTENDALKRTLPARLFIDWILPRSFQRIAKKLFSLVPKIHAPFSPLVVPWHPIEIPGTSQQRGRSPVHQTPRTRNTARVTCRPINAHLNIHALYSVVTPSVLPPTYRNRNGPRWKIRPGNAILILFLFRGAALFERGVDINSFYLKEIQISFIEVIHDTTQNHRTEIVSTCAARLYATKTNSAKKF